MAHARQPAAKDDRSEISPHVLVTRAPPPIVGGRLCPLTTGRAKRVEFYLPPCENLHNGKIRSELALSTLLASTFLQTLLF